MALIQYFARIQFAHGARAELPAELAALGVGKALVVTDGALVTLGLVALGVEALPPGAVAATFDGIPANPTEESVLAAVALYREAGCDGIIAIGGGSVLDASKAVALMVTHPGPLADYRVGGPGRIGPSRVPVVTIPTTAGTGSEIGRGMGISLANGGGKGVFVSPNLMPRVAICDPDLTANLPRNLTAGTGIDALSHCVEAFLSPTMNPPADGIALDGVTRLARHLPDAVRDGNPEARWNAMMGAVEGSMAMWKGLGAAHALSIPLDVLHLHHGTLIGVMLPHAVRLMAADAPAERLARLAAALGHAGDDPADIIADIVREIGLPPSLRAMGVDAADLDGFAAAAVATPFNATCPRPGDAAFYRRLAHAAFEGAPQ